MRRALVTAQGLQWRGGAQCRIHRNLSIAGPPHHAFYVTSTRSIECLASASNRRAALERSRCGEQTLRQARIERWRDELGVGYWVLGVGEFRGFVFSGRIRKRLMLRRGLWLSILFFFGSWDEQRAWREHQLNRCLHVFCFNPVAA